jgi:hypothetical protein
MPAVECRSANLSVSAGRNVCQVVIHCSYCGGRVLILVVGYRLTTWPALQRECNATDRVGSSLNHAVI